VVTAATVAVKVALEVPAATVTEAGAVTPALLLDRATLAPAGAAALRVTVQLETPAPVKEVGEQVRPPGTTGLAMVTEPGSPAVGTESAASEVPNASET
jgi:hypothetical protein